MFTVGPAEPENTLLTTVSEGEIKRLLHRGKFLNEIRRQIINAIHERDAAVQKADSLERELRNLRQDMIQLGENLYEASEETNRRNFTQDIRRVASGLINGGKYGSKHRELRERKQRCLKPYPQRRIYICKREMDQ